MTDSIKPALLTKTEIEWLQGRKHVSKGYEYRTKSDIRIKLQTFKKLELPLLERAGILQGTNLVTNPQELSANPQTKNTRQIYAENVR